MGKLAEREEVGEDRRGDEEDAATFSKLLPETRHQKALNPWGPLPLARVR